MAVVSEALNRHKLINAITRRVGVEDWALWQPHSKLVRFEAARPGPLSKHYATRLIFPTTAIFSISSESRTGSLAESSLAGNEGVVGLWMLARKPHSATRFTLQTAGFGIVVSADLLNQQIGSSADFRVAILNYASAMVRYATQTCFCYRYHSIEEQITKTLLLTLRRTGQPEIETTHQALGAILGIRREAVSAAIRGLHELGLVKQQRGRIVVLRVKELEAESCECYPAICDMLGYSKG